MKRYLLFFIAIIFNSYTFAHLGNIKGGVYDELLNHPIEGAYIYVNELKIAAVSDGLGVFGFQKIPSGKYTLTITSMSYEAIDTQVVVVDNYTAELKIFLKKVPFQLKEISVVPQKDANFESLSSTDLNKRPINSSQDLLRYVPGLFIAQHAGGGKAEQIFLRGFDIDHGTDINIQVDGMPVNMVSHAHGQGYADLHFLIPELVDKVSFGKGPYKVDKGNFATAGWVEFTTPISLKNSMIKVEGGLYGNFRTVIMANLLSSDKQNDTKQNAYIVGEYNYNRGYFQAPQNFNRINIFAKYANYASPSTLFQVSTSFFKSNWTASGQIPNRLVESGVISRFGAVDSTEGGLTSRYNLNFQLNKSFSKNAYLKSNLYLNYYDFELYSNFTFNLNDSVNGDQIRQKENRLIAGYTISHFKNYSIGKFNFKSEIGAGMRYDFSMNNELSRTRNRKITITQLALGDINETNIFAFTNQTFFITPKLVFNAGLRFDYFIHDYENKLDTIYNRTSISKFAFSPKAGLYYNFNDNARIFFNFGVGFHTNDTRVVVRNLGNMIMPLATSYDLGFTGNPFKKLLINTSVWLLDLDQEFVYVGDEAIIEQAGRSRRMGVDLSVRYEALNWLYFYGDVNYTYAFLRDEATSANHIPLAAPLTAIGGVTFNIKNVFSASISFRYLSDRPAVEDNSVIAKGYALMDAVISYTRPKYEFSIQAQNLLNSNWNEAQFLTESKLQSETQSVSEIHFTPGTPIFIKITGAYKF